MGEAIKLWEKPIADEIFMIAGWHQWADAGSISSGLPQYLIDYTEAKKIGEIKADGFYLYQIPGTHHLLRPEIKLEEGQLANLKARTNEFYYTGNENKGLVIFLGTEPHLDIDRYAEELFDAVEALGVKRVVAVGGVYGSMPHEKDRAVSCSYSLPGLLEEMNEYAVQFSNYEGGASIGSYFLECAMRRKLEYLVLYAFVPAYDLSQFSSLLQGMSIDHDFKAWYDLMRRFNYMFGLELDLTELERQSVELLASMNEKIREVEDRLPQVNIAEYMQKVADEFTENPFMPLGDVWEEGLDDLFEDIDD